MKKVFIILLLLSPFYTRAQQNLLGKPEAAIQTLYKGTHSSHLVKDDENKGNSSDTFYFGSQDKITCYYNKSKVCIEVIQQLKFSAKDSVIKSFNSKYIKKTGEPYSNTWCDKQRTFKVRLATVNLADILYLDYLPINGSFSAQ